MKKQYFAESLALFIFLLLIASLLIIHPSAADEGPIDEYAEFNQFCLDNFGAESDALYYEFFGDTLKFVESGSWVHESRNSAAIAFETNLPAKTYIEYGPDTNYGQTTEISDRYYFLHLHYLKGLDTGNTYHYRIIATDERNNTIVSEDRTVTTHLFADAIEIPGTLQGPPYILNQANAHYILTQNIVSDTRGISIKAMGITLDLNGYTITYDEGTPLVEGTTWNNYLYNDTSSSGIHFFLWNAQSIVRIYNGIIIQGQNNGQGHISVGFNPILINGGNVEIAGITAEYSGHSVGGFYNAWGAFHAHHNVLIDKGTGVDNRHQGIKGIFTRNIHENGLHHNLLKRSRHQAVMHGSGGGPIYSNEIYMDSWDLNSFGIKPSSLVENNRIFGTGYNPQGISWVSNITVRDNFIHMQGVAPTTRAAEYGTWASVSGMRLTQYGGGTTVYENNLYEGNTIIIKIREGTTFGRGVLFCSDPYVYNLQFRNNTIKTEVQDNITGIAPCVAAHGSQGDMPPMVLYSDNRFFTNSVFVRFGDSYAVGLNHQFRNNEFYRFGTRPGHYCIQIGYWKLHSYGHRLIDTVLFGGADLENNAFVGNNINARLEFSVGHSLHIIAQTTIAQPIAEKRITISDNTEIGGYEIKTDQNGLARLELINYSYVKPVGTTTASKLIHTNHSLNIPGFELYNITSELFAIQHNINNPIIITFTEINDTIPPTITNPYPTGTITTTQPEIRAALLDNESGIDTTRVYLIVNEINHTANATITPSSITYTPTSPLTIGTHTVNITAYDYRNNVGYLQWSFTIRSRGSSGTPPPPITESSSETTKPPIAHPGGPYTGYTNTTIQFNGTASYDPDRNIIHWFWTFGDGTNATGKNVTHLYTQPGLYTVTLVITDDKGATAENTTYANISTPKQTSQQNKPPIAHPGGPYTGYTNTTIQFNGTASYDPDGTILHYSWTFGDGHIGDGPTPTHIYTTEGEYEIYLTVTDNHGASTTNKTTAQINNKPPENQTPGFTIPLLILSITTLILCKQKKRKK